MPDHNTISSCPDSCPKRNKLLRFQFLQRSPYICRSIMGILNGIPVSRKMLQGAHHATGMKALHCIRNQLRRLFIIITVCPFSDHGILRIRPHISHRCEIQIKPIICQIAPKLPRIFKCRIRTIILIFIHRIDRPAFPVSEVRQYPADISTFFIYRKE